MDRTLRSLERAARASPDDVGALRALASACARAGDERGAWRAQAALARVGDALDDWWMVEPAPRAPATPARARAFPRAGEAVLGLKRGRLLVQTAGGLAVLDLDGGGRTELPTSAQLAAPCGLDWLVCERERALLVDAAGSVIADARLDAGRRAGRPPGFTASAQVTGDRAVVWHWTSSGHGARTVLDVGERFGAVIAHVALENRAWSQDQASRVVAGRRISPRPAPRGGLEVAPVAELAPAWSLEDAELAAADARGVVAWSAGALGEHDLVTGERRWSTPAPARPWVHLTPGHVVLRTADAFDVHERERGERVRSAPALDVLAYWVVGVDLVLLRAVPGSSGRRLVLAALDAGSGVERWRASLDAHDPRLVDDESWLPAQLVVGDGALALSLIEDPISSGGATVVVTEA